MSRSAGRVLIRPLGDYDATETYEMLDCVEYEGTSYLCKQTSTGNLPTNKTYWQRLADVGIGDFITLSDSAEEYFHNADISKSAGDNEDVTLEFPVTTGGLNEASNIQYLIRGFIGGVISFNNGTDHVNVIVSSALMADVGYNVIVKGKLETDDPAAISLTNKQVYLLTYNSENMGNIAAGKSVAVDRGLALGYIASSKGSYAAALGYKTAAYGQYSVAEGQETTTSGTASHAEGYRSYAFGDNSHAEGENTWARGKNSHAGGKDTQVTGNNSFGHGLGLQNGANNRTVVGQYNSGANGSLFVVGNGSDAENRSDAFNVYDDGYISIGASHKKFRLTQNNGVWGLYDEDGIFYNIGVIRLTQTVTLDTTNDTVVTFTNAAITSNARIAVSTSVWGINPSDVSASTGSCTVTIPKADSASTIDVEIEIS